MSHWNWANIDKKELVECAYETLWSVRKINDDYYLDMALNQRSNDYIMAGYINKIQYVALQMMVASHLGYKVGKFCHFVQNLHVYDRHIDACAEILNRDPLELNPSIELNTDKDFYSMSVDDFVIKDTKGIQKLSLKLEIAI
jgi:thymidylate synthase